jgi:HlyD family secretion protein
VEAVLVEVGDVVEAGDVLVQLEDDALARAVDRAEQSLAIQEANLESLLDGPTAADIAAAEAAVASAQAQLDDVLDGPSQEEIEKAEADLRAAQANVAKASRQLAETRAPSDESDIMRARANVEDAQNALQTAEENYVRTVECEQQADGQWSCVPDDHPFLSEEEEVERTRRAELQVVQARENLNAAQAELDSLLTGADQDTVGVSQANVASMAAQRDAAQANLDLLLAGPTQAEVASARAALADAEANLADLRAGTTEPQIASAEAQVEQARIALERARNDLADAALPAPFNGIITAVYVSEGELASGVAVDLVDLDSMEVVLDVDEVDIGQLEVGQQAMVTLEAWPEREIESEIVTIAPAANSLVLDNSIATYPVHLSLSQTDLPVRVDMTADARLLTSRREDVLLVPNRAITADREEGKFYVNLVETGPEGEETVRRVEVTIGLRDDQYTQITSGLSEGDKVRIGTLALPDEDPFD